MPGKVLGDPASLGYGTNAVQTSHVMRYAENLAVFTESTILFQNLLWNIVGEQGKENFRLCLSMRLLVNEYSDQVILELAKLFSVIAQKQMFEI